MLPIVAPKPDFIEQLLRDQHALSAVERFSLINEGRLSSTHSDAASYPTETSVFSQNTVGYQPAQSHYYRELLPASPPGPGQQYAFEVNLDKCSGCKACVVACHTLNGLEEDEAWRRVGTVVGSADQGYIQHVTTACHHCEDPGCLKGCPVKAYEKDPITGIVRHLDDQCIGCKYCTMMCPYEVPRFSERLGIVRKCDMCHQRLSTGEAPACVQACPNAAIAITVVATCQEKALSDADNVSDARLAAGAPTSRITRPTTRYTTKHIESYRAAAPRDIGLDQVAESHWPLAVMLVATQLSVGIVLLERLTTMLLFFRGETLSADTSRTAATAALLLGGFGLGLAPLHLGQPLRAWRAFLGLRTSWLSREAVLLGQYLGLLALATAMLWSGAAADYLPSVWIDALSPDAVAIVLTLAAGFGLVGLYSSAMIYIVTRRRLWRPGRTLPRFFGSAAAGGLAWAVPLLLITPSSVHLASAASFGAAILLAVKLIWECSIQLMTHLGCDEFDARSRCLSLGPLRMLTVASYATGSVAVALAVFAALFVSSMPMECSLLLGFGIAVLASGSELCERLLYFSSVTYERMPGSLR